MGNWTTKVISNRTQIDLHPDLNCFPAVIRGENNQSDEVHCILLSKEECYTLMIELVRHFGGLSETP